MSSCLNVFVVHRSDSMGTGVIEIIFHTGGLFHYRSLMARQIVFGCIVGGRGYCVG